MTTLTRYRENGSTKCTNQSSKPTDRPNAVRIKNPVALIYTRKWFFTTWKFIQALCFLFGPFDLVDSFISVWRGSMPSKMASVRIFRLNCALSTSQELRRNWLCQQQDIMATARTLCRAFCKSSFFSINGDTRSWRANRHMSKDSPLAKERM